MFGIFKKKEAEPHRVVKIMETDDAIFTAFVGETFSGMDRATRAHVLVAYQNLIPILSVMMTVAKRERTKSSIEYFIADCATQADNANDEVNSRRYAWFLFAAMLYRLGAIATKSDDLRDKVAYIWCSIARDAPLLKTLLPNNCVWKEEEKEWFSDKMRQPEQDFVVYTINHGSPKTIWDSPEIQRLAEEFGLRYFKSGLYGPLLNQP